MRPVAAVAGVCGYYGCFNTAIGYHPMRPPTATPKAKPTATRFNTAIGYHPMRPNCPKTRWLAVSVLQYRNRVSPHAATGLPEPQEGVL